MPLPTDYEIKEGIEAVDFAAAHAMLVEAYWCKGAARERIEKAAAGSSLVLSVWQGGQMAAYARIVSDKTTFGWICDVIVHERHRGRGLGRAMVDYALRHPDHQGFRRWVLATKDAQGVYQACGFEPLDMPESWMVYRPLDAPERAGGKSDVV